jgi:hypothetical protein
MGSLSFAGRFHKVLAESEIVTRGDRLGDGYNECQGGDLGMARLKDLDEVW